MTSVITPTPAPKTSRPRTLVQPLTGSVAMKNAPTIRAPEKTCCSGAGLLLGSASQAARPRNRTVPIIVTGTCQPMTRRHSSHSPPIAYQLAIHSHPNPPKSPKIGNWRASVIVRPVATLVRIASSGVAPVTASQEISAGAAPVAMASSVSARPGAYSAIAAGSSQAVMAWGKLINTTT